MNRTPVTSSDITSIGYDPKSCVLEVEFKRNSRLYQYENVPPTVHEALVNASSIGAYFHTVIKNGGYSYREIKDK